MSFDSKEDCNGKDTSLKRSLRSCGRWKFFKMAERVIYSKTMPRLMNEKEVVQFFSDNGSNFCASEVVRRGEFGNIKRPGRSIN
jgi:hypothetical protein